MTDTFRDALDHELIPLSELHLPANRSALRDPWMDDEAAYPPAPVKVIEITDEVRAQDEAERQRREQLNPAHPWAAVKASLGKVIDRPRPKPAPAKAAKKPAAAKPSFIYALQIVKTANEIIPEITGPATPSSTTQVEEVPPMPKTTHCACGKPLSAADIAKGKTTAWGHANGCPTDKSSKTATPAQPSPSKPNSASKAKDYVDSKLPARTAGLQELMPPAAVPAPGQLLLPVSVATLDHFLLSLPAEDKLHIVAERLAAIEAERAQKGAA